VEFMTSELLLSMTDLPSTNMTHATPDLHLVVPSFDRHNGGVGGQLSRPSPRESRAASRWASRIPSRAESPVRGNSRPLVTSPSGLVSSASSSSNLHVNVTPVSDPEAGNGQVIASTSSIPPASGPSVARADETHIHSNNPSSRQQHGIFSVTFKPISGITPPWSSAHSHAHAHIAQVAHSASQQQQRTRNADAALRGPSSSSPSVPPSQPLTQSNSPSRSQSQSASQSPLRTSVQLPSTSDPLIGAVLLHRAFTEVPDYSISSRGFLGGGAPPLDTLRDLPTYESSEASRRMTPVLAAVQETN
jgi:hypothetical protein